MAAQFTESDASDNVIFGRRQIIEIDGSLVVSERCVARPVQIGFFAVKWDAHRLHQLPFLGRCVHQTLQQLQTDPLTHSQQHLNVENHSNFNQLECYPVPNRMSNRSNSMDKVPLGRACACWTWMWTIRPILTKRRPVTSRLYLTSASDAWRLK